MSNTIIYQVPELEPLELNQPKREVSSFNLEDLHPHREDTEWFTTQKGGTATLLKLLVHPQSTDYYQWVSKSINQPRWNCPSKFTPYNYRKLLTRFCPDLFHLYWHPEIGKVVQLNVPAIKKGRFEFRILNLVQLRQYICSQMHRIQFLLNPQHDSVVERTFDTRWFGGSQHFSLFISLIDAETLLPHIIRDKEFYYFSESVLEENKFPKIINVKYRCFFEDATKKPSVVAYVENLSNQELSVEELHTLLDRFNFMAGNTSARIKKLHTILQPYGISLQKKQKRVSGKRLWFYKFLSKRLERVEFCERDYKRIKNA